jgi:hypothetical protein
LKLLPAADAMMKAFCEKLKAMCYRYSVKFKTDSAHQAGADKVKASSESALQIANSDLTKANSAYQHCPYPLRAANTAHLSHVTNSGQSLFATQIESQRLGVATELEGRSRRSGPLYLEIPPRYSGETAFLPRHAQLLIAAGGE